MRIGGKKELGKPKNLEALNDEQKARERFRTLGSPESEEACVSIIIEYYNTLRQFGAEISDKYMEALRTWLTSHNLRYQVTEHCDLELTVQGTILTQYEFLKRSFAGNQHRLDEINDMEKCLAKMSDLTAAKNLIKSASTLLEGIVIDRSIIKKHKPTLGAVLPGCKGVFAHQSLQGCVANVWEFCNDYPDLRHPGNPSSSLRKFKKDDALLLLTLTIAFGTYIKDNDASEKILSGNI